MNDVNFFNESKKNIDSYLSTLKGLIDYAIGYESLTNVEFNVIFVDNKYIRKINKDYRGIDRETDVITFALEDNEEIIDDEKRILGDIYISIEKAITQAEEYNHSILRELSFLMIHGFLHLLGYDHIEKEDEEEMFKKQELILDGYGISR